jgi:hypothetical protein
VSSTQAQVEDRHARLRRPARAPGAAAGAAFGARRGRGGERGPARRDGRPGAARRAAPDHRAAPLPGDRRPLRPDRRGPGRLRLPGARGDARPPNRGRRRDAAAPVDAGAARADGRLPALAGAGHRLRQLAQRALVEVAGLGPHAPFESPEEYDAAVDALVASGVVLDTAQIYWTVRPSAQHPTLEVRVTDVCATSTRPCCSRAWCGAGHDSGGGAAPRGRAAAGAAAAPHGGALASRAQRTGGRRRGRPHRTPAPRGDWSTRSWPGCAPRWRRSVTSTRSSTASTACVSGAPTRRASAPCCARAAP